MNINFEHKIVNIFYSFNLKLVLDAQKNCLIEARIVLLSNHNICFG